jgi:hypothetical protein
MAKKHVLDLKTDLKVSPDLMILKALGDALVCIGMAPEEVSLLDGTLQHLGYLIIEKVDRVGQALGVMEA